MSDSDKPNYKATLNLPSTEFPMRAGLVESEPKRLEKWEASHLYSKIQEKGKESPVFLLHDGPPFANGDVHMGTALNKILKDLILKSKTMSGFRCPYIPGWDCHGLPIEFKVMQENPELDPAQIRDRSEQMARKFIDIQRGSFKRLGVFADWENPYLTMDPGYEADIIRAFGGFVEKNLVYQDRKPVLWSYGAKTALAEAEVDYKEKKSPAIFVSFQAESGLASEHEASFVIWTTTPWTLPANSGIAVHPRYDYVIGSFSKEGEESKKLVIAKELVEKFAEETGYKLTDTSATTVKGHELAENSVAAHPFLDRTSKVITAEFVTTETGTGAVHIAPGHGADDYIAGRENDLDLYSPVDDDGKFTDECGLSKLVGVHVFSANNRIIELLTEEKVLLGQQEHLHEYPHCWRSKKPVIFRSVLQFFIKIEEFREQALKQVDEVKWLPSWAQARIRGTVESRPDWCISRQRTWGVPLPVFYAPDESLILDKDIIQKVAELVEEEGTNLWFEKDDEWWCDALGLEKGTVRGQDTLDVWIDSGCSHIAVLDKHEELSSPADLYLEATDQHRGWFQSSLMVRTALTGKAPYRSVLTHGFVVDTSGVKISKSAQGKGKPMDAAHFYDQYGADLVRLWVSSVDWSQEVPFSDDLFKQVAETYRRVRNTFRILLGNIGGYERVDNPKFTLIDTWILERVSLLNVQCQEAYKEYDFHKVYVLLNQFCSNDLSSLYVDITKDRLYCDANDSERRVATVEAMARVFEALLKLFAPILPYTTDEAWEYYGKSDSIHLENFPEHSEALSEGNTFEVVEDLLKIRSLVQKKIEPLRQSKTITSNADASVELLLGNDIKQHSIFDNGEALAEFLIVADVTMKSSEKDDVTKVSVTVSDKGKCPRCWNRRDLEEGSNVCKRCEDAIAKQS